MIEIIKVILQGVGLFSLILVIVQLRVSNKWKRLEFSINSRLDIKINDQLEILKKMYPEGLFDYSKGKIDEDEISIISSNEEAYSSLKEFLNCIEELVCLLENGALDKKYSYSCFSGYLIQAFEYFHPLINKIRVDENDNFLYSGISTQYLKWKKKENREKMKMKNMLTRNEKKIKKIQ